MSAALTCDKCLAGMHRPFCRGGGCACLCQRDTKIHRQSSKRRAYPGTKLSAKRPQRKRRTQRKRPGPESSWTPERTRKAKLMIKQGHSLRSVAAELGVDSSGLRRKMKALGVDTSQKPTIKHYQPSGKRRPWTAAEERRARALRDQGLSWRQIGAVIGRDGPGVRRRLLRDE